MSGLSSVLLDALHGKRNLDVDRAKLGKLNASDATFIA